MDQQSQLLALQHGAAHHGAQTQIEELEMLFRGLYLGGQRGQVSGIVQPAAHAPQMC